MAADDHIVKQPFGAGVAFVGDPSQRDGIQRKIDARGAFVIKYAREQGWIGADETIDPAKLSIEQILEVRAQDGWKNA
jgi:hypothetical protein